MTVDFNLYRDRGVMSPWRVGAALWVLLLSAGCATRTPTIRPPAARGFLEVREGLASYYGREFEGRITASGERFTASKMTAAHPTYPFGTVVRVINVVNGRSVRVRIHDRGPAADIRRAGVIIDLSEAAARSLRFTRAGRVKVRVEVLKWGSR